MLRRRLVLALLAAGATIALFAGPAFAAVSIVQPGQTYAGKNYQQWSIAWWQWAAGIGKDNNPVTDPTGASCGTHQRGPVWFLTAPAGDPTSPSCTVPADKAVLVPVFNVEWSTHEINPFVDPPRNATESELPGIVEFFADGVTTLTASVDGQSVDVAPFRTNLTAEYPLTWAAGNAFGADPGRSVSVADGWYLLIRPLSVGVHTIDVHSEIPGIFTITTHYTLHVTDQT